MEPVSAATKLFTITKEILGIISGVKDLSDLKDILIQLKPEDIYIKSLSNVLNQQQAWLQKQGKSLYYEKSLNQFQEELRRQGKPLELLLLSDSIMEPENIKRISRILAKPEVLGGIDSEVEKGWIEKIPQDAYNNYLNSMSRICPQLESLLHSRKIQSMLETSIQATDEISKKLNALLQINRELWEKFLDNWQHQRHFTKPLETELSWKTTQPAEFFREGSPIWVDFQEGQVFETRNIDFTLTKLKKSKICVVTGPAGSGKSVTVRYVGFKLRQEGYEVYIYRIRGASNPNEIRELADEITFHQSSRSVFIIEDLHVQLTESLYLVNDLQNNTHNCMILLTTRPYDVSQLEESQRNVLEELPVQEIRGNRTLISDIISHYCQSFGYQLGTDDINKAYEICGSDLFLLAYLMRSWDYHTIKLSEMNLATFYSRVSVRRLSKISEEDLESFLNLAALYQYEIPCQKDFLARATQIVEDNLASIGGDGSNFLYLNHSSAARLYIDVAFHFKRLPIKNYTSVKDFSLAVLKSYLRAKPYNFDSVIDRLVSEEQFEILSSLIMEQDITEIISESINNASSIYTVSRALKALYEANQRFTYHLTYRIDLDQLIDKVQRGTLLEAALLASAMAQVNLAIAHRLIQKLNVSWLKNQVEICQDVRIIGFTYKSLYETDWNFASKFASATDAQCILDKLNTEENIASITYCLYGLTRADRGWGEKMLDGYGLSRLKEKLNKENNLQRLALSLGYITKTNSKASNRLSEELDQKILIDKLNLEKRIKWIAQCLGNLRVANSRFTRVITKQLDRPIIVQKIMRERYVENLDRLIFELALAHPETAWELLLMISMEEFLAKIEKETSLVRVGYLLGAIAVANHPYAEQLVEYIFARNGVESLCNKIYENMKYSSNLFMVFIGFAKSNRERALELVHALNITKFSNGFEKRFQLENLGKTLNVLANLDPVKANKIANEFEINILQKKIESVGKLDSITICLRSFLKCDREIAWDLTLKIESTIIALFESADNLKDIGECLQIISQSNPDVTKKALRAIKKNDLSSKVENEKRAENIAYLIRGLYIADSHKADQLLDFLSPTEMALRLDRERNLGTLAHTINILHKYVTSLARQTVSKLNIDILVQKIHTEVFTQKITDMLRILNKVDPLIAKTLVGMLNVGVLKAQISETPDLVISSRLIYALDLIEGNVATKLIDINKLQSKLANISDLRRISKILLNFKHTSDKLSEELLSKLYIQSLLMKEMDAVKKLEFLGVIQAIKSGNDTINNLKRSEIRNIIKQFSNEENPLRIGAYPLLISAINHPRLNAEVLHKINFEVMSSKLTNSALWQTCWAIWMISVHDISIGSNLGKHLFSKISKLKASKYIEEEFDPLRKAIILAGISVKLTLRISSKEISWWKSELAQTFDEGNRKAIELALVFADPEIATALDINWELTAENALDMWMAVLENAYRTSEAE